jgi:hypothetical protein
MTNELATRGFGIKINYGANSNPAMIFRALSDIVNSLQQINRHLLLSIDLDIEAVIILENIEQGSIVAWLKDALKSLDDKDVEDLNFKRIVGVFLNKARYAIIDFTNKNDQFDNKEQVENLQQEIIKIAEESELKKLPIFSPIDSRSLLSDIGNLQDSLSSLSGEDLASYLTAETEIPFNKDFIFSPDVVEEILTKETIESQAIMILKVKKPDYLGESKWEFKYENRKLEAKIKDSNWLSDYHNGKIDFRPGASLRVSMKIAVKYDYENEVISTQYEILEVIEIISPTLYIQTELA